MRIMSENDYKIFEMLVTSSQDKMFHILSQVLHSKYSNIIETKEYLVAVGDIPIALVSHMDTVFATPVVDLYYDTNKNVMWSPDGLGADDRAGIFLILKILQSEMRPSIIFTTDEEIGGLGALSLSLEKCPIPNLKYLIELDRQGHTDCVFYSCDTKNFKDYIAKFGFKEQKGSFSDISFLMPAWNICGVNLSVGYFDEHSVSEILKVEYLFDTYDKLLKILNSNYVPDFQYISNNTDFFSKWNDEKSQYRKCAGCGEIYNEYDLFPVEDKYYCVDCIVDNVDWCEVCGNPYIIKENHNKHLCDKCAMEAEKEN